MKEIIYNTSLNPDFWDKQNNLDPEVKTALIQIACDFYKQTNLKPDIQDIRFLGSSTNYNWTKDSDVDLHVVIDFSELDMPLDYATKFTRSLASRWNTEHKLSIKEHAVEVYLQDINEVNRSTGVYSLMDDKWVKVPSYEKIKLEPVLIQQKYSSVVNQIKTAITEENVVNLKKVMEDLITMRNTGLTNVGEFSTENIVFKLLRKRGYIKKLKYAINNIYDKQTSVKEGYGMGDPTKDPKHIPGERWRIRFDSDSKILK